MECWSTAAFVIAAQRRAARQPIDVKPTFAVLRERVRKKEAVLGRKLTDDEIVDVFQSVLNP